MSDVSSGTDQSDSMWDSHREPVHLMDLRLLCFSHMGLVRFDY